MLKSKTFLHTLVLVPLLAACTPMEATRGNIVDQYRLADLKPGMNQADVVRIAGSPTAQDPFDPAIWYYMGQKTEKRGILDPKVVEEHILRLRFNPSTGTLAAIEPMETARNDIPITSRKTPTEGHEINAVQQMIGNLGKFNKKGNSPTD